MKRIATLALAAFLVTGTLVANASAEVRVSEKKFSNCTALNAVYPGGVAKSKTVVNKGGKTKQLPTVNANVYSENKSKDRDGDGIACER